MAIEGAGIYAAPDIFTNGQVQGLPYHSLHIHGLTFILDLKCFRSTTLAHPHTYSDINMKVVDRAINDVRTDYTWNRVARLTKRGLHATPTTAAHYVVDKAPIVGWLPRYNPRWIINDVIAGLTIG